MAKTDRLDVFICHASEDKGDFVEPLAQELRKRGLGVWFDKFELTVGSSLRESIELGLAKSRFGIVVFSENFLRKKWPKKELNGLFSKELRGHKTRILPIRHNIDMNKIGKQFPIQSDRMFLSSDLPIDELCEQLIRVIRPKMLEVRALRDRSDESTAAFIEAAKKRYPGFDVGVSYNVVGPDGKPRAKSMDIRSLSPSTAPMAFNIQLAGEGARKMQEFIETGKPQRWSVGEVISIQSTIPFFPEFSEGIEFSVGPITDFMTRPVRLECGESSLPYLTFNLVRRGTREAEFKLATEDTLFSAFLIWPLRRQRTFDIHFHWDFSGIRASRSLSVIRLLEGVAAGLDLKMVDLSETMPCLTLPIAKSKKKFPPFDPRRRRYIELCARIEERFNVSLFMGREATDEDLETLKVLSCLLNGSDININVEKTLLLRKGENPAIDTFLCGPEPGEFRAFTPVNDYNGFIQLLGVQIPVPLWGVSAKCILEISDSEKAIYREASDGFTIQTIVRNDGPGRLIWASDAPTLSTPKRPTQSPNFSA